jgi:integrative and conjugative element protein (TIGR02256 family)
MDSDRVLRSEDGEFTVRIRPGAWKALTAMWRASSHHETGGILVGRYTEGHRTAVLERATGPSTDGRAGATWFVRGVRGLQELLDTLWRGGGGYYLGEWHSHPGASPDPSGQDVAQMRTIAGSQRYQCPEPILLILGGSPGEPPQMWAEVFTRNGHRRQLHPTTWPTSDGLQTACNRRPGRRASDAGRTSV